MLSTLLLQLPHIFHTCSKSLHMYCNAENTVPKYRTCICYVETDNVQKSPRHWKVRNILLNLPIASGH